MFFFWKKREQHHPSGKGSKISATPWRTGKSTTPHPKEKKGGSTTKKERWTSPSLLLLGRWCLLPPPWGVFPSSAFCGWRGRSPISEWNERTQKWIHSTFASWSGGSPPPSPRRWWFALTPLWRQFTLHLLWLGVRPPLLRQGGVRHLLPSQSGVNLPLPLRW